MPTFFPSIKSALQQKIAPAHYLLCSALLAFPIAFYSSSFKVTVASGGYQVALIKLSWYLAILALNWLSFALVAMPMAMRQRPLQGLSQFGLFVLSHMIGIAVLASSFFHFYMFQEHWNWQTISTAFIGLAAGKAPMQIDIVSLLLGLSLFIVILALALQLLKLIAPLKLRQKMHYRHAGISLALSLSLLTLVQHQLPYSWHAEAIQKELPWFNFIGHRNELKQENFALAAIQPIENERQQIIKAIAEYPLPETLSASTTPNILILHIEALRSDMLNPENMPQLYAFAKNNAEVQVLPNHYASSNNSGNAVFGIVNGLSGIFYQDMRRMPYTPLPTQVFEKLGYELNLHATINTSYQDIRELSFPQFTEISSRAADMPENELSMVEKLIERNQSWQPDEQAPRFDYLIFNSTHFNYHYPESHEKFVPAMTPDISYAPNQRSKLEQGKQQLFNRFKNSVLYADTLVNKLIEELTATAYWDNTIVVIVGDHGQEFWEHNRFGHNYGFVNEQTKVVGIIRSAQAFENHYQYSNHHDIMPTLFSIMGLQLETHSWMDGKALNHYSPDNDFATTSLGALNKQKRYDEIVVAEGLKIEFQLKQQLTITKVTSDNDEKLDNIPYVKAGKLVKHAIQDKLKLLEKAVTLPQVAEQDSNAENTKT